MSGLTLKPIMGCNLACAGCYEATTLLKNPPRPDIEAMIQQMAILAPGQPGTLHGGEVTMLRIDEAERLCQACVDQKRTIGMQTNATLLTDKWLDLIDRYQISVGVSLNGPGPLNRSRWAGTEAATDRATERAHESVRKLAAMDRLGGVIVVLSSSNAANDEDLDALIEWARDLGEQHKVWDFRWNLLFDPDSSLELTTERAAAVYVRLLRATMSDPRRAWLPFRELVDNLCGLGVQPCWLAPCDPYQTGAVNAVFGDGSRGNCLRTSPDGTPWQRADQQSFIRQDILFQIPMDEGGCGGCRYWNVCHGGCPAEGEGGDWRNKTRWCGVLIETYAAIEQGMKGWMPNWRPVTDWAPPDPEATAQSINNRQPKYSSFSPMLASARHASTWARKTRAANDF